MLGKEGKRYRLSEAAVWVNLVARLPQVDGRVRFQERAGE